MSKEKERLINMLQTHKITDDEYQLLSAALDKKSSRLHSLFLFLINPFQKISGVYALITGFFLIICMSYFGVIGKVYFPGILDFIDPIGSSQTAIQINFNFFILLYENMISWVVLACLFMLVAKIFKQKRTRVVDFFGMLALSRLPYAIFAAFFAITRTINPGFMLVNTFRPSLLVSLFFIVVMLCVVWQITLYFYALKESSGLSGKKLWISYIVIIIFGEIISNSLTTLIR